MLWGSAPASGQHKEHYAEELCRYFIGRKVSGVFFAPVELTAHQQDINLEISAELTAAGIPIVLVDRCVLPYPGRSRHDLAGIDNHRAGYRLTDHLAAAGCRAIAFAYRPGSAPTVDARMAGIVARCAAAAFPNCLSRPTSRCGTSSSGTAPTASSAPTT